MAFSPARSFQTASNRLRLALFACLYAISACGEPPDTLDRLREDVLRAGYSEEPPYAFLAADGGVSGEGPEALEAAMVRMGLAGVRWIRLDFRELIPALLQGRIDVIAAGLFHTEERARDVLFTRPTACPGPGLIVALPTDGPARIEDVLRSGERLAVLTGSVEQEALARLGLPSERTLAVPDLTTATAALRQGDVRAVAVSLPTARWAVRGDPGALDAVGYAAPARVAGLLGACSALALRPGDRRLAVAIDSALAGFLASPERRVRMEALGFGPGDEVPGPGPRGSR